MPTPALDILPDVITLVRSGLLARTEVTGLCSRIGTISPTDTSTPWVRIVRLGGTPAVRQRLDQANLQVDCFAPSTDPAAGELVAHTLARTVRAALHALPGWSAAGGLVTAVADQIGLQSRPDSTRTPPTPRWLFGVTVTTRPNP